MQRSFFVSCHRKFGCETRCFSVPSGIASNLPRGKKTPSDHKNRTAQCLLIYFKRRFASGMLQVSTTISSMITNMKEYR